MGRSLVEATTRGPLVGPMQCGSNGQTINRYVSQQIMWEQMVLGCIYATPN